MEQQARQSVAPQLDLDNLDSNIAASEERARKLETYKQLQVTIARLEAELKPSATSPNHRRLSADLPDHDKEIKFKNVPTYTLSYSLQERQEWLLDLQQMFEGAPKRYHDGRTRILGALNYMDTTCRQRWYRHIDEKATNSNRNLKEDWPYFREWTLTLIKNTATLETEVMGQLERTFQHKGEDPREFHARLDTLEQHFPRLAEKERALAYFAKLRYDLQNTIRRHVIKLPESREEIIDVAYHFWDLDRVDFVRKRKRTEGPPERPRKRTTTDESSQESLTARNGDPRNQRRGHWRTRNDRETSPKSHLNAIGKDGKRNRCYNCGSERHYSNRCPKPQDSRPVTVQSAQRGNGAKTE